MRVTPILLVLSLGAQCNDNEIIDQTKDDSPEAFAEIEVTPEFIDFGDLRLQESEVREITIANRGTKALNISSVELAGGSIFSMGGWGESPAMLEPEGELTVEVTFSPAGLEHEGQVVVISDDPRTTRSVVSLYGQGLIPVLSVYPSPYDFGQVEPECERPGEVTIENIGLDTLEVTALAQIGEQFILDDADIELPFSLEPGEHTTVNLSFLPDAVEAYTGELWVGSNAGDQVVAESGEGAETAEYTDEWSQPVSNVADIFFYVDQSCSMEDDQERLSSNFLQFTDALSAIDADYQVMVATADSGCHNVDIITQDTPTAMVASIFRQAVQGPSGIYTEAGLMVARNAVAPSQVGPGGCNQEFLRDNATVTFVLISDEPEQSPSGNNWSNAVRAITTAAPSSYVAAVVGPLPDGCETAEPGTGYIEAAGATGGIVRNICDYDWGTHLAELAELATQVKLADTFYLRGTPQEDTIRVWVNDEEVTVGWSYDEAENALVFEEASVPGEGAEIRAVYASGFVCD